MAASAPSAGGHPAHAPRSLPRDAMRRGAWIAARQHLLEVEYGVTSPAASVHLNSVRAAAAKKTGAAVPRVVGSTVIAAIEPVASGSAVDLRDRLRNDRSSREAATGPMGKAGAVRKAATGKAIARSDDTGQHRHRCKESFHDRSSPCCRLVR